jgi:hypothetical protein
MIKRLNIILPGTLDLLVRPFLNIVVRSLLSDNYATKARFNKYDIPTIINIFLNDQNQKVYALDRSATIEIPVLSRKVCGDTLVTFLKTLLK